MKTPEDKTSKQKRPNVAVNAIVLRDGHILLGMRKGSSGEGTWGLPGGHLEYMESVEMALARELLEETGLVATTLRLHQIVNNVMPNTPYAHYIHLDFIVEGMTGEPQLLEPDKCKEWKWFGINTLPPTEEIFFGHQKSIATFLNKQPGARLYTINGVL